MKFAWIASMAALGCDPKLDIGDFDDSSSSASAGDSQSDGGGDDDGNSGASASTSASGSTGTDSDDGESVGSDSVGSDSAGPDLGSSTAGGGGSGVLCDPLLQDCPDGETCVWADEAFRCLDHVSSSQLGEICEEINDCDVGYQCADPVSIGCAAEDPGCCTRFCDVSIEVGCVEGTVCTPWFEEGQAPPGLENVGTCVVGEGGGTDDGGNDDASGSGDDGGVPSECDGLLQDCADGDMCVPTDENFVCVPDGDNQLGEACAAHDECEVGLLCVTSDLLPACADEGCCTRVCDLSFGDPWCDDVPGTTCNELPGAPLFGNENTGYCTL